MLQSKCVQPDGRKRYEFTYDCDFLSVCMATSDDGHTFEQVFAVHCTCNRCLLLAWFELLCWRLVLHGAVH